VFAGGDVAFGPRNLIEAIAIGQRAARSIHEFLAGGRASLETVIQIEALSTERYRMIAGFERIERAAPPTLALDRRTGIAEVETGYERRAAEEQAARCLVCHVQTIYDPELRASCNRCVDICPEYCLAIVPVADLDLDEAGLGALAAHATSADQPGAPLSAMVKDDQRCIRCEAVRHSMSDGAMTMERFTITERWSGATDNERTDTRQIGPQGVSAEAGHRGGRGCH
jgi:ferredoxin